MGVSDQEPIPPADPAAAPPRAHRSAVRSWLIIAGGVLALAVSQWGGALGDWYRNPFRGTNVPEYVPPEVRVFGQTVHLPPRDGKGRPIPGRTRLVLAPAPCGSCTDSAVWIGQILTKRPVPVVALYAAGDHDVAAALDRAAPRVYRVDPAATRGASAAVMSIAPLFAATDGSGRIVGVSRPGEDVGAFCERLGLR